MTKKYKFILLPLVLLISGCSTTFKSTKLGDSGYFETNKKLHIDGVTVNEDRKSVV